ncbi:hypothetical protein LQ327_10900 [Actinomycetospora endophytica]|uniref:Uncharacterized protein n=1 Tax=Actinomycetospora endophytica TaxID=2291215 RepID=A0ABS8P7J4_9PSEU|nr:hypothetical protein [Actinomycetospora endophytica]MCD2193882.1 hypothetical protein [Actinomycetospora endophytica]
MARSRHAMRVHPLRSKGVVVGVPVAAAVAFGAHTVLGVTPLSDHQDTQPSSSAPQAGAPVQSYGLAATPPPTTLGLLAGPSATSGSPSGSSSAGATTPVSHGSSSAGPTSSKLSTVSSAAHGSSAPAGSIPITRVASSPAPAAAPSMMSFASAPAAAPAAETHQAAPQAVERAAAPAASTATTHAEPAAENQTPPSSSPGGALLSANLGVAKVSVLSFGG